MHIQRFYFEGQNKWFGRTILWYKHVTVVIQFVLIMTEWSHPYKQIWPIRGWLGLISQELWYLCHMKSMSASFTFSWLHGSTQRWKAWRHACTEQTFMWCHYQSGSEMRYAQFRRCMWQVSEFWDYICNYNISQLL